MRHDIPQGCIPQLLRNEMRAAGLEPCPAVHYDPADRWVEVDSDDPRVPSLIAGHAPDGRKLLPPSRAELLEMLEQEEAGTLPPQKQADLRKATNAFLREQILGGS